MLTATVGELRQTVRRGLSKTSLCLEIMRINLNRFVSKERNVMNNIFKGPEKRKCGELP